MGESSAALYALQQIDTRIAEVERELEALDDGTALKAQLEELKASVQSQEAQLHELEKELLDTDLQMKSFEEKKADCERRMYSGAVSNPKELSDMQREVETLGHSISNIEDKALALMDQSEENKGAAADARRAAEEAEQHLAQVVKTFEREGARCRDELADLAARRRRAVPAAPAQALKKYEDLRPRKGNLAIVLSSGGICEGCHVSLAIDLMRDLKRSDQIQVCDHCGRILHLAEE